jgi:NAD(P) transhydrogenase subunit alpha
VALVPESVGRLAQSGFTITIEPGAGVSAAFLDEAYAEAGAELGYPWKAEAVCKVAPPSPEEAERLHEGGVLIGFLQPLTDRRASTGSAVVASWGSRSSRSRGSRARSRWTRSRRRRRFGVQGALLAADGCRSSSRC